MKKNSTVKWGLLIVVALLTRVAIFSTYAQVDPIRLTMETNASQIALNEEFEIIVKAQLISLPANVAFTFKDNYSFKIKVIFPKGFRQTGGSYSDYAGTTLSDAKPMAAYSIKGMFVSKSEDRKFSLMRSNSRATEHGMFALVATLAYSQTEPNQRAENARTDLTDSTVVFSNPSFVPYLTISDLRIGHANSSKLVQIIAGDMSGEFFLDSLDSTTPDDGCMVLATNIGERYKRGLSGSVNITWFGAKGDGVTDNAPAFSIATKYKSVFVPPGIFRVNSSVELRPGLEKLYGEGAIIMGTNSDLFYRNFTPSFTNVSLLINPVTNLELNTASKATYTDIDTKVVVPGHTMTVNSTVVLKGNANQDFFSEIKKITGDTIVLADKLTFTLGLVIQIAVIEANNLIVDGLTFGYLPGLSVSSGNDIFALSKTKGITIRNCKFIGSGTDGGISVSGVGNVVSNCQFEKFRSAVLLFNAGQNLIKDNRIVSTGSAIRAVRCHNLRIVGNYISNGSDSEHGIGIELTAESGAYDKNCYNSIIGNTVINVNHGVVSSGIGGIHLNFSADHNIIQGNISKKNSFGIYLENDCDFNTISDNDCSYNDGYYGVGIELDWNNDNNLIVGNNCSYNVGSVNANESSGIQLRAPDEAHVQYGNVVVGNVCNSNGREGIRAIGRNVTVSNNVLKGNGLIKALANRCGLYISGRNISATANTISDDSYDPGPSSAFSGRCIIVANATNVTITSNSMYASYYSKGGIYAVTNSSVDSLKSILISSNNFKMETANGRAVDVANNSGVLSNANDIELINNLIDSNDNGQFVTSMTMVNKFAAWGNTYVNAKSLAFTGSLNRVTPSND
jgi:parallel beta-helix repeat protein